MFTEAGLDADAFQGTTVFLLDARGEFEAANLLEIASLGLRREENEYNREPYLVAELAVDVALFDSYTDDLKDRVRKALNDAVGAVGEQIGWMTIYPKPITGDWREARRQGRLTGLNNQATRFALPEGHPRKHGLNFRDSAEVRVFEALERLQASLPAEDTILIAPNAGVFVAGRTFEMDFIVTYRGRVGGIEVDGSSHVRRYAADQSRHRMLRDAGLQLIEHIVAQDTNDPAELDSFLRQFILRLTAR